MRVKKKYCLCPFYISKSPDIDDADEDANDKADNVEHGHNSILFKYIDLIKDNSKRLLAQKKRVLELKFDNLKPS